MSAVTMILMQNRGAVVVLASCVMLSGCQTTKQDLGTVLGAGAGALIGSQFGSGTGQIFATLGGAAIGGLIGNQIGKYLDEEDKKQMAAATQKTVITGETIAWNNPDSGVSGRTEVVKTETRQKTVAVPVLKDRVKEVPPLDFIGETYLVKSNSNVRGGPGTDFVVVDSAKKGSQVEVVGKVVNKSWYMVGNQGVGQGFVHDSLLTSTGQAVALASNDVSQRSDVATTQVAVSRPCRTVNQTVVLTDGSEQSEEITACKGPNGWEVI